MQKLLEYGRQFCKESTLGDLALLKILFVAFGMIIGLSIQCEKARKVLKVIFWVAFGGSFLLFVSRFLGIVFPGKLPQMPNLASLNFLDDDEECLPF